MGIVCRLGRSAGRGALIRQSIKRFDKTARDDGLRYLSAIVYFECGRRMK